MEEYRRKKVYVDKIFQKKFLILFLTLTVMASTANILYLFLYLKKDLENNLYRSRIIISNVNEVIAGNVLLFNTAILMVMILFSILFYYMIKHRVQNFVNTLKDELRSRQESSVNPDQHTYDFPEDFSGTDRVLTDFFQFIDKRQHMEKQAGILLKNFINNPCHKTRKATLEKIREILNCGKV